jgi:hypothetical protein
MKSLSDLETKIKRGLSESKQLDGQRYPNPAKLIVYKKSKKKKMTFYISEECESMINEIYTSKLIMSEKIDKSQLICQAIDLMFKKFKGV